MNQSTITTYGPCCRCTAMARHILLTDQRRHVIHLNPTLPPCPIRPGEMPENGQPQQVQP
jgi:hypothetical protein